MYLKKWERISHRGVVDNESALNVTGLRDDTERHLHLLIHRFTFTIQMNSVVSSVVNKLLGGRTSGWKTKLFSHIGHSVSTLSASLCSITKILLKTLMNVHRQNKDLAVHRVVSWICM